MSETPNRPEAGVPPSQYRPPEVTLMYFENIIAERVDRELERRLPAAVKQEVAQEFSARANWWQTAKKNLRTNWHIVTTLVVGVIGLASWRDARVGLHRQLLSFDATFAATMANKAMYSTGGTFVLKADGRGSERSWQLPFVANAGQLYTIHYRITFSDSVPVPLSVVVLGAPKEAPVRLQTVADESGTIKGTVTDLVPEGGKPPKDGVYTLVVAVSDRITDNRYASGTFVVQVIGAPFHGDSLP